MKFQLNSYLICFVLRKQALLIFDIFLCIIIRVNNLKVSFYTLGCKVNSYESQIMRKEFENHGWQIVKFCDDADAVVVHSCAVTEESARKTRQMLRKARRFCPDACIAVVGCLAQISPESLRDIADVVSGSKDKKRIVSLVTDYMFSHEKTENVSDISHEHVFEKMILENGEKTRAQIKIEDGCDNFCSYCIIPYARGRVRSKSVEDVMEEVSGLVEKGYSEIVLTGIQLDAYRSGSVSLPGLLEKIDDIPGLLRIRLGSLEPSFINNTNVAVLKKIKHLCPHFHLSLQSGCNDVLRRMNRHYTTEEFFDAVMLLRENFENVSITTDIIAGFPGESDADFLQTVAFAKKAEFSKIHVFPFSPREGTVAYTMSPRVSPDIKKKRVAELLEVDAELAKHFACCQKGRTLSVLFEQKKNGYFIGYAENYVQVAVKTDKNLENIVRKVKIIDVSDGICFGVLESDK